MQEVNFKLKLVFETQLTCCFESLWTCLTTSTWNDFINLLLPWIPNHMQNTNSTTQLIFDIRLKYLLFTDHTHLKWAKKHISWGVGDIKSISFTKSCQNNSQNSQRFLNYSKSLCIIFWNKMFQYSHYIFCLQAIWSKGIDTFLSASISTDFWNKKSYKKNR